MIGSVFRVKKLDSGELTRTRKYSHLRPALRGEKRRGHLLLATPIHACVCMFLWRGTPCYRMPLFISLILLHSTHDHTRRKESIRTRSARTWKETGTKKINGGPRRCNFYVVGFLSEEKEPDRRDGKNKWRQVGVVRVPHHG
ncbi:unnamed protein product, partial [Ectocarpus sp. 13 AM-2016]